MKTIEWGYPIVLYLFLGGLSAGLFFVSAVSALSRQKSPEDSSQNRVSLYGALLAPWPLMLGCLLLIFDLGVWHRFWKLFLHFQYTSPMSIGSWLLAVFSAVSLAYFYAWLNAKQRGLMFSRLPRKLAFLRKLDRDVPERIRLLLAALGLPLSIGVGIYTGVLLGAVQSRPFWNTNLVAQLFLFSALSTGCAAVMLVLVWKRENAQSRAFRTLYGLDAILLILELFIIIPYIVHGQLSVQAVQDSLQLILGGPFTVVFWIFFAGLGVLLPLSIELFEIVLAPLAGSRIRHKTELTAVAAVLVLAGGLLLRYIFVFAGQASAFN